MRSRQPVRTRPDSGHGGSRQLYSYYNSQTAPKPEKSVRLDTTAQRLRLLPTVVAIMVIAGSLLFSMTLSTSPAVSFVGRDSSPYRSGDEYGKKAEELLGRSLLNRTKITIDTDSAERALMDAYPEIAAAQLRLPVLGRKPVLLLDIRAPELILATSARSFVLDSTGLAVAEMRDLPLEKRQGLLVLQDQSGLEVEPGRQAVTSSTVAFIREFEAQLREQSLTIEQLVLPAVANELDIYVSGQPYFIKADTSGDARLQAGSYLAAKDHLAGQGITPAMHMDVRVEERVFYR